MELFIIGVGCIFAIFSTVILSYISMTTMVGPWIAPTLVLLGHSIFRFRKGNSQVQTKSVASMQAIGAVGGILATGVGFALPMLYFLDAVTFNSWLASPGYFCSVIAALCLTGGGLGIVIGHALSKSYIEEKKYPFPVSQLTNQVITSQNHPAQAKSMTLGITGTLIICAVRDGIWKLSSLISKTYYVLPSYLGKEVGFTIWPSLWAIGYSVGLSVTLPLFVGLISKYLIIYPLANHANYLPFSLFAPVSAETFTVAFCGGLALCEVLLGLPKYITKIAKYFHGTKSQVKTTSWMNSLNLKNMLQVGMLPLMLVVASVCGLLTYLGFGFLAQILLIVFTFLATYSICQIGAEIGMIPFGRYSTFIVVPLLLLFKLNPVQITITCVFFGICAAAASDLMFDYKTGELCGVDQKKMYRYQWIGLIATSLCLGLILWLIFTHLQVGSEALFAQRAKSKVLLLQSLNFDLIIVSMGIVFGWVLKKLRLNPTMVFGGLLMPNTVTIGLALGGLSTKFIKNKEAMQPICAGVLAAESLWVIISILAGMI